MRIKEILKNLTYERLAGKPLEVDFLEISGISTDSAKVRQGDLFICYCGVKVDSHDFVLDAVKAGAAAIICERELPVNIPQIIVKDGRSTVAKAARAFYGYADRRLKLVAVTGTNGKTTVTHMLKSIFDKNLQKTAIIGTLGIRFGDKFISPELTTPDPVFLHSVFADMAASGIEYVFMEASAHAIYFNKLDGLTFDACIFTNCTQDHLDFFKDMKSYADVKAKLFTGGACKLAILNSDDRLGADLLSRLPNALSYGLENPADTFAVDISESLDGTRFVINILDELYDVELSLPALHNVYNALAAATCAKALGVGMETIAKGLASLKSVSGRLEKAGEYNGGKIFVDFAHTPDGLQKTLECLKKLCKGKLFCVFGCGGNRDASKRPVMGEVAAKLADFLIITSDNPRYEDPFDIISQIECGARRVGANYVTVTERESAIEYGIKLMSEGDVLLVAGKGGENYQEIMGIKHEFSDNDVISRIING